MKVPQTLREIVDSVKSLSSVPLFSNYNLWHFFGIRPGNGVGLKFFHPDTWKDLDPRFQKTPLVNQLSAVARDYNPRWPKGMTPVNLHQVAWKPRPKKRPVSRLKGKGKGKKRESN